MKKDPPILEITLLFQGRQKHLCKKGTPILLPKKRLSFLRVRETPNWYCHRMNESWERVSNFKSIYLIFNLYRHDWLFLIIIFRLFLWGITHYRQLKTKLLCYIFIYLHDWLSDFPTFTHIFPPELMFAKSE